MTLEQIRCTSCGSTDVVEIKQNTYACRSCETVFKFVDPTHAEVSVAPQFCEEGCGNPIKYKCALCGRMVCEEHGGKAPNLFALIAEEKSWLGSDLQEKEKEGLARNPNFQVAWCVACLMAMDKQAMALRIAGGLDGIENSDALARNIEILGILGDPSVVTYVARELESNDYWVKRMATYALQRIGGPSSVSALAKSLASPDHEARCEAIESLGMTKDSGASVHLFRALGDNDFRVRATAARVLGRAGDPSAIPQLKATLTDSDFDVRYEAAEALGNIEGPSLTPYLTELKDDNPLVRFTAVVALGNKGGYSAVPHLRRALKDGNPDVRRAAAIAFISLAPMLGKYLLVPLIAALKDSDADVRQAAVYALQTMRDPRGLRAISREEKKWNQDKPYKG